MDNARRGFWLRLKDLIRLITDVLLSNVFLLFFFFFFFFFWGGGGRGVTTAIKTPKYALALLHDAVVNNYSLLMNGEF